MWWEDLRNFKDIMGKELSCREVEKYFQEKYLSERYYDRKVKELHKNKLGKLTIYEYTNIFLELFIYVPYIKDEMVKIQMYLSGLPQSY